MADDSLGASTTNCSCINEFEGHIQEYSGDQEIICKYNGYCFVSCHADCDDLKNTTGFFGRSGLCKSEIPCTINDVLDVVEKVAFDVEEENEEVEEATITRASEQAEFVLMSTGNASAYQGSALGVYTLLPGTTAYHQKGGDYYLYQDKDTWYLSPHITGCNKTYPLGCAATWVASIKTKNIDSVGSDWSYAKDKEWSTDDPTLQFVPITSDAAACITCSTVIVRSGSVRLRSGPFRHSKPDFLGRFNAVLGLYSAGRPVYKNNAGRYLMIKNEYTSFAVWDDAERRLRAGKGEEGGRSLRSRSAPTCVGDLQSMTGRMKHGWQFRKGEEWGQDDTIAF